MFDILIEIFFTLQVDCEWDDWKKEGDCSQTCGGGIQLLTRQQKVESEHGGKECIGPSNITEICNVQKCPGKDNFS